MADGSARYRDVLRIRDFRLLVFAFLVDQVGSWAYNVVLIVWVFDRTHSPTWIAAATASGWIPRLVWSAYAGVLADRYERTSVMLASSLSSFVAMIGVALVVAANGPPALALLLGAIACSFATGYRPAAGAVVPDVVSERELVTANAIFGGLENLVIVLGPGIGGLLLVAGSPAAGITLNAFSFLAAALLVMRLRVRSYGGAGAQGESVLAQFGGGLRALRAAPMVVVLIVFCYLDSAVYGAGTVVYVPLSERLGTGSNGYSYLLAGMSLGGVLLAAAVNRISASARLGPLILVGMLMLALPYAALAAVDNAGLAFVLQMVSGGGMLIVDILAVTAIQRDLPGEVLSRVFGLFEAGVPAALLLASFASAVILHVYGLKTALLAIGFGFSGAAVLGLLPLLRADRRAMAAVRAMEPRIRLIESLDLFAGASRLAIERLARAAEEVSVPADYAVIREGAAADALWVLVQGEVAVSARGESRHAHRLRTMVAGTYFGEIGLLRRVPRTATVQTLEPSVLLRIDGADFLEAVQNAGVSTSMLSQSSARLARTHPRLATSSPLAVEAIAG
jgi:CRP-like cAMP-binding protein